MMLQKRSNMDIYLYVCMCVYVTIYIEIDRQICQHPPEVSSPAPASVTPYYKFIYTCFCAQCFAYACVASRILIFFVIFFCIACMRVWSRVLCVKILLYFYLFFFSYAHVASFASRIQLICSNKLQQLSNSYRDTLLGSSICKTTQVLVAQQH